MMGDFGWFMWPFGFAFAGLMAIVMIVVLAFWIWMIVDCAKRSFRNSVEKIIWLIIVVIFGWVGALVYLIIIKLINTKGLISGEEEKSAKKRR